MLLIDGGRAVAGLCFVENLLDATLAAMLSEQAAGQAFNVSDGIDVSWGQLAGDIAAGLALPGPRLNVSYRVAERIGLVLEQGYRVLHRATKLTTRPLLSRQAVNVMGIDQSFSNRKAREMLGWEPRVGYADGLAATLDWLRAEGA
jgi:nucleoside-diphosphate-sugar epimerase